VYKDKPEDLRALFRRLDVNNSGSLTSEELEPLAKKMGIAAKSMLRSMDTDGNKKVNWPEFRKYMRR
jgi:Ca2+-binding EF-hand superfamily protein